MFYTKKAKNMGYERHKHFPVSFISINYKAPESRYRGFLQIFTQKSALWEKLIFTLEKATYSQTGVEV
jgi:hypothetical protein